IPTVANTGYQATFTPTNANYATVTNNNVPITVNPAPITSAVIAGITTPATGGTPTPTANVAVTPAGAANTTAAVTWNPVHNPFRGGTQYTASVTLAANTNYVFTGLSNATINGTAANITNVTTTSATISYQFAATAPLVVTFNGNGGTPATSTWTVPSTTTTVGTANMPANPQRTGYTFNNWNTQPNGSGTAFTGNTTVTVNITVYAQYTANTYTVNFYGGSISGVTGSTASQNFTYDASQALRANGFTRTGFILKGWSTSSTVGIGGAINYNPGQTVSNLAASGAINLYAVWDFRWNIGDQGPENTGMIFYRSTTGFNVNGIGTCYYLEVQNGYRPASYQYTIPLLTAFAGSESGLGSGYRNTQYLLAIGNAPAAETAGESFAGGWFLPSIDELALLYQQRTHQDIKFSLGDTGSGPFTSFWSSSDTGTSSTSAYIMYFNGANTGSTAARPKSESHNIVSVRAH
ncbi:MAG: InlB B-repeat-containing protein, partial [Spirochaetaceae bacterium]|nr:InlB B-repeat-containing protein [Spirochaetaceae bacterium]